jgi:hypothetical protein
MPNLPLQLTRSLISRKNARGLLAVTICGSATLALTPAAALAQDNQSFWTQFAPSQDTRLVFVSSSQGNDANSGLNPNEPVKSLNRAYDLLRDGYPDWMLLKRGDVWHEQMPSPNTSGRSESEKLIIGAYGDDQSRPQIRPYGEGKALQAMGTDPIRHIAYVGLHIEPANRQINENPIGIRWLAACEDVLFEDIYIDGFSNNITFQAYPDTNVLQDITINGCIVVDAWSKTGHSQGIFAKNTDGLTIKNSVFDHNGWNAEVDANPTVFNHNIYLQGANENAVVVSNVLSDASSHGVHFRSGGELSGNLFLLNPISIDLGGGPGSSARPDGAEYNVENNLVMYGRALSSEHQRSWGIAAKNTKRGSIKGNILANAEATQYNVFALRLADPADGTAGIGFHDLDIQENYFIGWPGPLVFYAPTADQPYSNVNVSNNYIYRDLDTRNAPLSDLRWQSNSELNISSNKYYVANPTNSPFKYVNQLIGYEQWSDINEPDSTMSIVPSFERLDFSDFMSQQGLNGDVHDYIEIMRSMSRQNPQPLLLPSNAYQWAREKAQSMN